MTAIGKITEREIAREARRVLRKLAGDGAMLVPKHGTYALTLPNARAHALLHVKTAMVEVFRRRDWLSPVQMDFYLPTEGEAKTAYVLSDAGLGWLRRALADEDPFASQHQLRVARTITDEQGVEHLVTINEGEDTLGWLHRRRLITHMQLDAGERLRRDFTLARLTPRLAADLSAPVIGGKRGSKIEAALPETVLAAKQRFSRALAHVGPGLADLLIDVCCHLNRLEDAERIKGWPKRSGRVVLQIALDRLAVYYGMAPAKGATRARIRAWAAPEDDGKEKEKA